MTSLTKPTFTYENTGTLAITDLETVMSSTNNINNVFFATAVPFTTTAGNRVSNLLGKVRIINIAGVQTGSSYAGADIKTKIAAFITEVEAWINNGAQTRLIYTNQYGKTFKVFCRNFNYVWAEGNTHINYTFELVEGGGFLDIVSDLLG